MNKPYSVVALLLTVTLAGFSQSAKEDWVTYVTQKNKGPMVITSNVYYNFMGRPNYKNVLVVGTNTRNCKKNGYPDELGLAKFYMFSDSIASKLDKLTKNRLVGILTYQCSGFDVYYIKDTTGVKDTIQSFLDYNYALSKNYISLTYDKKWKYYKENLIPKDFSDAHLMNHELLNELVVNGNNLAEPQKVNHWINFRNEKRRMKFINKIRPLGFAVDSLQFKKDQYYKFQVKISRKDSITPTAINKLTSELVRLSLILNGIYYGWGIEPVK